MTKCMICKKGEAMPFTIKHFDTPVCEKCLQAFRSLNSTGKKLLEFMAK